MSLPTLLALVAIVIALSACAGLVAHGEDSRKLSLEVAGFVETEGIT